MNLWENDFRSTIAASVELCFCHAKKREKSVEN
jgi:hypothetical protein